MACSWLGCRFEHQASWLSHASLVYLGYRGGRVACSWLGCRFEHQASWLSHASLVYLMGSRGGRVGCALSDANKAHSLAVKCPLHMWTAQSVSRSDQLRGTRRPGSVWGRTSRVSVHCTICFVPSSGEDTVGGGWRARGSVAVSSTRLRGCHTLRSCTEDTVGAGGVLVARLPFRAPGFVAVTRFARVPNGISWGEGWLRTLGCQ